MSDGPHKSLPMRPGWKKFAERAAFAAFDCDQVAELAVPALEDDWNDEVAPHIDALRNVLFDERQGRLLGQQNTAELEQLKRLNPGNTSGAASWTASRRASPRASLGRKPSKRASLTR